MKKSEQVNKEAIISHKELSDLINILNPSKDWDKTYEGKGTFYGYGFELTINCCGLDVESKGSFAFPEEYDEMHSKVVQWLNMIL